MFNPLDASNHVAETSTARYTWMWRRGVTVVILALMLLAGVSYWTWQQNTRWQNSAAAINGAGGKVFARPFEEKARRLLGDDRHSFGEAEDESYPPNNVSVTFDDSSSVTPKILNDAANLPGLDSLSLSDKSFAPEDLAALQAATNLHSLFLYDTSTNDASLVYLKELKQLEMLGLARTQVTDRGLAELVHLPRLTYLSLNGLPITDEGVKHLCQMSALTELEVLQTDISKKGLQRLRIALPNCKIIP